MSGQYVRYDRIVIVGAGLAGHRAAQTLRREGFAGELVFVGDEPHRPYDRPPLSKQLLAGAIEHERCFFPSDDLDASWELGGGAVGLGVDRNVVTLSGGDELEYDGLVIATGRRAREWPELPSLSGFHTLRSLDDMRALRDAVTPASRVAIVGAGFIGCEVAATLRGLGVEAVTLIDVAPHPMPVLGAEVGSRAARIHERHGVRLRMGTSVASFEGVDAVEAVRLAGGERVEADLVLLALGSLPNSEWLGGSGLTLLEGNVRCDEYCLAVGAENIVAAGDIAAYAHPSSEVPICIEHWSNAREMGAAAAANLLRDPADRAPFVAVPTFWSDQYELKIKSAGLLSAADSYTVVEDDPDRPALIVEAHRQGTLVGAIGFNRARTIIEYQRRLAEAPVRSRRRRGPSPSTRRWDSVAQGSPPASH
jgi:NADPH-dependent 2,4-dienoyl-CoA reductase/sulfur reductase-like enzyme